METGVTNNDHDGRGLAQWLPCPGCPECAPNDGLVLRRGSWRPTKSWEPILILVKGMGYFSNAEAVQEQSIYPNDNRKARANQSHDSYPNAERSGVREGDATYPTRNPRDVQVFPSEPLQTILPYGNPGSTRRQRQEQGEGHYAAFPPSLPTFFIKAFCPERVCAECQEPWAVVVERTAMKIRRTDWGELAGNRTASSGTMLEPPSSRVLNLRRTCSHAEAGWLPGTVLDCYAGTGTTILAALRLGRRAIGIELSPSYAALARARIIADAPLFQHQEPRP